MLIGHVTKDGSLAGPRVLEHLVDTVLSFEGDRYHAYRLLRAVKNRFGSTDELGIFEMRETGLEGVDNPSAVLLSERAAGGAGSVVTSILEGSRALLVEIQALVARSNLGSPRRTVTGMDPNRINMILAVLEKRLGLRLAEQDVYVNVAGGVRVLGAGCRPGDGNRHCLQLSRAARTPICDSSGRVRPCRRGARCISN